MNLSRREQFLFLAAMLLVAFFLAYAFAILPAYDRYKHEGALIHEKNQRLAMMQRKLDRADLMESRYRAVKERMDRDRERKVTPQQLFADIQTLAGPMGVTITGVDPLPRKEYNFYEEHTVLVDIETGLEALVDFLYEIENGDAPLQVQRLTVTPVEPGSPVLRSQVQIATRVFRREAEKQ